MPSRTPNADAWYVSRVGARDTKPHSAAIQIELYRKASPSQRAQVAVDLSEATRVTAVAGIRRRHPEYSERDVARAFIHAVYGTFRRQ